MQELKELPTTGLIPVENADYFKDRLSGILLIPVFQNVN